LRWHSTRTEDGAAPTGEEIRNPTGERRFGADDRQVNSFGFSEREDGVGVSWIHGDGPELASDAGVAWRANDFIDSRLPRQFARQGMFAGTAPYDEDSHLTYRM
jgi:hypothetical protein